MAICPLPDGDELYYEVHGAVPGAVPGSVPDTVPGAGPPLLLVPGLGGVATFFEPHVAALAEHFTVILHDHRGTGRSSLSLIDYSVEQMSLDVLCLLDHLELDSVHYLGHSTGGAIGQILAIEHPQRLRKLVLSATWAKSDAYFKLLFDVRSETLRTQGPQAYLRANSLYFKPPQWLRDHPEEAEISLEAARAQIPEPEIVLRRIAAICRFDRRDQLGQISQPTLILCARDDIVTPVYFSEELGRLITTAETVILPAGGHFYPSVYPGDFRRIVTGFLLQ